MNHWDSLTLGEFQAIEIPCLKRGEGEKRGREGMERERKGGKGTQRQLRIKSQLYLTKSLEDEERFGHCPSALSLSHL